MAAPSCLTAHNYLSTLLGSMSLSMQAYCCSEWSATVESNIVNKGYSFTMNQYYSLSQNKVRVDLHANGSDTVLIQVSLLKLLTHP